MMKALHLGGLSQHNISAVFAPPVSRADSIDFVNRARWICEMASTGRDFPAKVWPMAFSKCRRARKSRKTAPGGQHFKAPPGALLIDLVNILFRCLQKK